MNSLLVCIDLSNESVELIKKDLSKRDLSSYDEIHLVHSFQTQVYADSFYYITYPLEGDYEKIEESVEEVLKGIEKEIGENFKNISIKRKCLITNDSREAMSEYVRENSISRMYIATMGKHGISGLFKSSFAEYMVRHASCELLIIRS